MSAADVLPSPRENWRRRTALGKVLFPAWAFAWCFWYVVVSLALAFIGCLHINIYRDDGLDDRGQMGACKDPLWPILFVAGAVAANVIVQMVIELL